MIDPQFTLAHPNYASSSCCAPQRLHFADVSAPRLTHYLFRFPAKFHAPVVHKLLRDYTDTSDTVLDPFCGSGTLLVAAAAEGRTAIGSDLDPVAVFASTVKTRRLDPSDLRRSWAILRPIMESRARSHAEYQDRQFNDLSRGQYDDAVAQERLWVPPIPNLLHWFRRYVVIDLSRIHATIAQVNLPGKQKAFFYLMFASIIRAASNADPVPVSGLEVTSHMKRKDAAGRTINPFQHFIRSTERGLDALQEFWRSTSPSIHVSVIQADATLLSRTLRRRVDAVITSPPYHNAVDYYRRHQLEMYWLALTPDHGARLRLLPKYIGRATVRARDPRLLRRHELGPTATGWHHHIAASSPKRANAFLHYIVSMNDTLCQLAKTLRPDGNLVLVVGHSQWNGQEIPTKDLFTELAGPRFALVDQLWYPLKNRYMSYGRRNGADIKEEFVLVFKRSRTHGQS